MREPARRGSQPEVVPAPAAEPDEDGLDQGFAELRSLLVGPERRELLAIQQHLFDPAVQTHDVSRVLPDALALRAGDPKLTRALAPSVEEALTASVRRDPKPLAEALFPVMGPAIRKAVAHAVSSLLESLNRTVEHSLSWRAMRWRWTALRTGRPFGEIVLLNTIRYRVEQVFLVHAESGLLLQHVATDPASAENADQISAMLTAIRDFARDSFRTGSADTLDAFRVGGLSVIVEQGPEAILAAVVRGTAPYTLRGVLQDALEAVHRRFGPALKDYQGDASALDPARPILEECLVSELRVEERRSPARRWALVALVVLAAAAIWAILAFRERQRFDAWVDGLRRQPGLVVLASGRRDGAFYVQGLRDPLAADPAALLASSAIDPGTVAANWQPYQSLEPELVRLHAHDLLRPPDGVTLDYSPDGVLTARGRASSGWIADSERLAPAIPGVRRLVYAGAPPATEIATRLEAMSVRFARGLSAIPPDQSEAMGTAGAVVRELQDALAATGGRARVEIVGHADADGPESTNDTLSRARAQRVAEALQPVAGQIELVPRGVGTAEPLAQGTSDDDKALNRRVTFRVTLSERPSSGSAR